MSTPSPATSGVKRIALFAATPHAFTDRAALVSALTSRRHKVRCYALKWDADAAASMETLGAETASFTLEIQGWALMPERKRIATLARQMAEWEPHVVAAFSPETIPAVLPAARKAGAARTLAILDQQPDVSETKAALSRQVEMTADEPVVSPEALKKALSETDAIITQNPDDTATLQKNALFADGTDVLDAAVTGVDLAKTQVVPLPPLGDGLVFAMSATADRRTGAETFVRAARLLKQRAPNARFVLTVTPARTQNFVSAAELEAMADGAVEVSELPTYTESDFVACHVVVHPARSDSGPVALFHALAGGRPVITTDIPGCRDTVDERVNGCLVKRDDPEELAEAMQSFLRRPDLIPAMARASRLKAERRYDRTAILPKLLVAFGIGN